MEKYEKINDLEEAKECLFRAMNLVRDVFPNDGNVEAYFLDQIAIHASQDHGFLSNDLNIDDLIQRVRDGEDEEDF